MDGAGGTGGHAVSGNLAGEWNYTCDSTDGGGWGWTDVSGQFRWGGAGGGGSVESGEADFPDWERILADEWEKACPAIGGGGNGLVKEEKRGFEW